MHSVEDLSKSSCPHVIVVSLASLQAASQSVSWQYLVEHKQSPMLISVHVCLLLFSRSSMSESLCPYGPQHNRLPCPSPSSRLCSNSCLLSWWCHPTISSSIVPFSSSLQSFPASRFFPMSWLFTSDDQILGLPSNEDSGLISFGIDWFYLLAVQGTLNSFLQHHSSKVSIIQCFTFFMVQLPHLYFTIGKTVALTIHIFVGKVMSLLLNILSRFVIAFFLKEHVHFNFMDAYVLEGS